MSPQRFEQTTWALIYGGLIGGSLGWFVAPRQGPWGELLMAGGALAVAVGVVMIYLRSRMKP